ncbi:DUF3396 domain-containing protein [Myxococcota bacterium]|nr:DUF3396 domain-containing protein [Myxococcota bacterium]
MSVSTARSPVTDGLDERWSDALNVSRVGLSSQNDIVVNGRVKVCLALIATFYLKEGRTFETLERIASAMDVYTRAVGDVLVWGGDPKAGGRARKVRGTELLNIRSWSGRLRATDDFQPCFLGGVDKADASHYQFRALSIGYDPSEYAGVTCSVPLSWIDTYGLRRYVQLVMDLCHALQPDHGYAGLGLTTSALEGTSDGVMQVAVPIAKRFRGVEFEYFYYHVSEVTKYQKIKGINWLTILAPRWVESVGGGEKLEVALQGKATIHAAGPCFILRAGPGPRLGDANTNEDMSAYEAVSRALRPIRLKEMDCLAPYHGLDDDETAAWLARFDK